MYVEDILSILIGTRNNCIVSILYCTNDFSQNSDKYKPNGRNIVLIFSYCTQLYRKSI